VSDAFELLRARGVLSDLDWHFARAVGRIGGEREPAVLLAAALASRAVGDGHVCLDLPQLVGGGALVDDAGEAVVCAWPPLDEWTAVLRHSPLVEPLECGNSLPLSGGRGDKREPATPLVLDPAGRLYLRRYWQHQARLAAAIRSRAWGEDPDVDVALLADGLARLFAPLREPDHAHGAPVQLTLDSLWRAALARGHGAAEAAPSRRNADAASAAPATGNGESSPGTNWQRVAALVAVLRRFCAISGGPGTGKTHTVVRILALLVEQALRVNRRPPRVTLLAPTGKAAARLSESIVAGTIDLPCSAEVRAAIPQQAATIHRGLGAVPGRVAQFRHGPEHPLPTDVVLVDEASMVDLALMARLVDAMPAHARLILLGDQDQLFSVQAGAVLGDICNSGASRVFSRAFVERVAAGVGLRLPLAVAAPSATGIWDCVVSLTHSYRYRPESGIGRLAAAINAGDVAAVVAAFAAGGGIDRADTGSGGALGPALERAVREGFAPYCAATEPLERLRALERFRVLCAHRRGPFGVETVNAQIEQLLAADGRLRPDTPLYRGRPILITENDYQLRIFNGDVATIDVDPKRPSERVAVFLGPDGAPRHLAPARLPPHETVFAMSVHKSQGSEFDAVAVVLPGQPSPIVSRELLYTAVTRARARATVFGSDAVVAHAVTHRIERASGLRDELWE